MTTYDAVLNAPDHKARKDALDKYRVDLLKEGMEMAAIIADSLYMEGVAHEIRRAATKLEKADG